MQSYTKAKLLCVATLSLSVAGNTTATAAEGEGCQQYVNFLEEAVILCPRLAVVEKGDNAKMARNNVQLDQKQTKHLTKSIKYCTSEKSSINKIKT